MEERTQMEERINNKSNNSKIKIGLMGGTFNPIHYAHLKMAEVTQNKLKLDKILFIPDKNPPHKKKESLLSDLDRSNMIKLAIEEYTSLGKNNFEFSDIELNRTGTTYTSDTLLELKSIYPFSELFFIMGADSFNYLDRWHEPQIIFENATIVVFKRTDYENNGGIIEKKSYLEDKFNGRVIILEMPDNPVSSTEIRESIKQGLSLSNMLPNSVINYIETNKLYK